TTWIFDLPFPELSAMEPETSIAASSCEGWEAAAHKCSAAACWAAGAVAGAGAICWGEVPVVVLVGASGAPDGCRGPTAAGRDRASTPVWCAENRDRGARTPDADPAAATRTIEKASVGVGSRGEAAETTGVVLLGFLKQPSGSLATNAGPAAGLSESAVRP